MSHGLVEPAQVLQGMAQVVVRFDVIGPLPQGLVVCGERLVQEFEFLDAWAGFVPQRIHRSVPCCVHAP